MTFKDHHVRFIKANNALILRLEKAKKDKASLKNRHIEAISKQVEDLHKKHKHFSCTKRNLVSENKKLQDEVSAKEQECFLSQRGN